MRRSRFEKSSSRGVASSGVKLEIAPMLDVTFLLLVFFMLTVRFQDLEGKLDAALPRDVGRSSPTEPRERTDVRIRVVREGTKLDVHADRPWSGAGPFRYGPDRELLYSVGPHGTRDLDELEARLARLARTHEDEPAATLDPGAGTVYGDVVAVLDAAVSAGFEDIGFRGRRGLVGRR